MDSSQVAQAGATTVDGQLLELMLRLGSVWVLWLLLGLSVLAVAQMLERLTFFVRQRRPAKTLDACPATLRQGGPRAALQALGELPSMEAAVAREALRYAHEGAAATRERIEAAIERERLRYERGLAFLGTLGNNAPFIGLFGTVLGIIRAFDELSANTAQGAAAVMAGIAEALVATGVGLLVALPAVAAFNMASRHVEACVAGAQALGHEILAYLEANPRGDRSADERA